MRTTLIATGGTIAWYNQYGSHGMAHPPLGTETS
jgi:hypothetical protein